jgi:HlyD family secretion protein
MIRSLPAPPAPPALRDQEIESLPSLRNTYLLAAGTILALLGGLFGWSLFAHLDSAVVAHGTIISDSQRKTVQHLEGGILKELLVHEGQSVRAGEAVALLDTTQAESKAAQIEDQLAATQARITRLEAEQRGERELVFDSGAAVAARAAPAEAETNLFRARWAAHDSAIAMLEKRMAQSESEIKAAQAQQKSDARQLELFREEFRNTDYLLKQGMERRPHWLELQRQIAALEGEQHEREHTIQRLEDTIGEVRLQIDNTREERLASVAQDLAQAKEQEADLASQLRAARDILNRREIRAPQDGTVVELRLVTPGGVIGPGQALMDIVPADDELIVETRLPPKDIDNVHVGLPAQVRLLAYQRGLAPLLEGSVSYLSADSLQDQRTGDSYFLARVQLAAGALAALKAVRLVPGMPVDVMIVTGSRRAIDYFLEPMLRHLRRAFREE